MVKTVNRSLSPLPSDEEVIAAVEKLHEDYPYRATAAHVAQQLGVEGARRLGRGAVKGSWSGHMSGALRIAPRLESLAKQGKLQWLYDDREHSRSRKVWIPS
jgi:hypothetical protein